MGRVKIQPSTCHFNATVVLPFHYAYVGVNSENVVIGNIQRKQR